MSGDSYYEILGVSPKAAPEEIRVQYRSLIRRIHPDVDGPVALFRQVQEAYEVLSDPARRAEYDRKRSGPAWSTGFVAGTAYRAANGGDRSSAGAWHRSGPAVRDRSGERRQQAISSFVANNPAGSLALLGSIVLVIGAALGDAGWAFVALGCVALVLGAVAGLGRREGRVLEAYQRSGVAAIDTMSGREFEHLLGGLFTTKGYRVARLGGRGDTSADLLLEHPGGPTVVQVRRCTGTVHHDAVQQVAVAMERYRATRAIVVTSSTYSPRALTIARSAGVTLWNRSTLDAELAAIASERPSTTVLRLTSDVCAGGRVCLGVCVTALVLLTMTWRRVLGGRPTKGT